MIRPISIDSEAAQDVPASQQSGAGFTINLSDCNNNTVTGINTSALSQNETNNSPITPDLPHVVEDEMKDKFIGKAILDLAHLVEPFEPPLEHQVLLIYCCGYKLSTHYACFMKIPISYNS